MKQNEKFLVYAVTGFLMVVIVVAVVFGRERPAQAGGEQRTDGNAGTGDGKLMSLAELVPPRGSVAGADPAAASADPAGTNGAGVGLPPPGPVGLQPLATPPAPPTSPAALLVEKLGPSKREGDFRSVQARPKDTLSGLVQQWCGKVEGYLEDARSLNEGLVTLHPGQPVLLPWVDDEVVLAAYEARQPKAPSVDSGDAGRVAGGGAAPAPDFVVPKPSGAVSGNAGTNVAGNNVPGSNGAVAPLTPAGAARTYTVKSGDKLWTLAEQEVGRREAPRFIAEVRLLNPEIDIDRLKVGQQLRLPPRKS